MKIVGNVIGRWINRRSRKAQDAKQLQPGQRPQELDARALRQVSGGDGGSSQMPTKGW
jgi:hypothetical protein